MRRLIRFLFAAAAVAFGLVAPVGPSWS